MNDAQRRARMVLRRGKTVACLVGLCAALAATALGAAPGAPEGWQLRFRDDFERQVLGPDWVILRGDWHLKDGKLCVVRGWTSDSAVRTSVSFDANVRLEADVRVPEPNYVKAAVRIGDQFWDGGGRTAGTGRWELPEVVLVPAGGGGNVAGDFADLRPGRTYRVALQYEDGRLQAWVDGRQVKDHRAVLGGRFNDSVALFAIKDAEWDNVRVYTKPYGPDFRPDPQATPETNRRATVDASRFLDPRKPDCGFQEAIDSLPPTGGAVILPKGEFTLRQSLFLREGVSLRGQGSATRLCLPLPIVWSRTTKPAPAGSSTLEVEDASKFRPGWMLCFGDEMYYLRAREPWRVARAEGNTIHLSSPLASGLPKGKAVGNWFPAIYGSNGSDMEVRDLEIDGRADDPAPFNGGYGASAVTFMFVREVVVSGVTVRGWKGDAFSFQGGRDILCADNTAIGARGHGFHPGSCQQRMILSRCRAENCGGDGLYFCRYNQLSVMAHNAFMGNRGCAIGGLASAGDAFNAITFNLGVGNGRGVPFDKGANDVLFGNVLVNCGAPEAIVITGGEYAGRADRYHPYAGPSRYHVITGNTFVDDGTGGGLERVAVDRPGAAGNVVASNASWTAKATAAEAFSIRGAASVVHGNTLGTRAWQKPEPPQAIAPLPETVVDAAPFYDPARPECGFQRAIDEAAARGGGTVRLPAGIYPMTAGLRVPSKVTLCGEGLATVLTWRGGGAAITIDGASDAAVRRLSVRCLSGKATPADGVRVKGASGCVLEAVRVEGCPGAGIAVDGGRGVLIVHCKVRGCGIGYALAGCADVSLVESWALDSGGNGLTLSDVGGTVRVEANMAWRSNGRGMDLAARDGCRLSVKGNVVSTSAEDGLRLKDCAGAEVCGNVAHNSSQREKGRFAGVLLEGSTRSCRITGNRVGDEMYDPHQTLAVKEVGAADANLVRYNVLCPNNWPEKGALDGLVRLTGPASVAEYNVLFPYPPKGGIGAGAAAPGK